MSKFFGSIILIQGDLNFFKFDIEHLQQQPRAKRPGRVVFIASDESDIFHQCISNCIPDLYGSVFSGVGKQLLTGINQTNNYPSIKEIGFHALGVMQRPGFTVGNGGDDFTVQPQALNE